MYASRAIEVPAVELGVEVLLLECCAKKQIKVDKRPNIISKHKEAFYPVGYQVKFGDRGLYTFVFGRFAEQNFDIYLARRPYHVERRFEHRIKERPALSPQDPLNQG